MKNSIYLIFFLISSFLFFSCGSSSSSTNKVRTNPHADAHKQMHKEFQQEQAQKEFDKKQEENIEPSRGELQKLLMAKNQKGIDFYAVGNEPFWSLDMDFNKGFHFKNLDGLEFNVPVVKPDKAMDANVIRYRSATESGEIIIQLNQTECSDTMSGQKFEYAVTVDVKTNKDSDFKTYKGCGNYVPDFRLHNIWVIKEVNGRQLNSMTFKEGMPNLELNTSDNTIMGFDGCNNFNGKMSSVHGTITIGMLMSTMKSCPDNADISFQINNILSGKKISYKFEKGFLDFYKNKKKVLVLKNVD